MPVAPSPPLMPWSLISQDVLHVFVTPSLPSQRLDMASEIPGGSRAADRPVSVRAVMTSEPSEPQPHYFRPRTRRRPAPAASSTSCWPVARSRWPSPAACSARTGSTSAPGCCCARCRPAAGRRPARSRLRLGSAGDHPGAALPRGHGLGGRRQRAGLELTASNAKRAEAVERAPGPPRTGTGRRPVRGDLVEPADPDRQGAAAARVAAALAAPAGAGRAGASVRPAPSRRRLAAPLAAEPCPRAGRSSGPAASRATASSAAPPRDP
jgi:hypothetical protein